MPLSVRATVELFHLVFLRALVAKGEDKARLALKGGCNLRFFFGSVRYSEDIDLDVASIGRETLKNKVERLLRSPLVLAPLKSKGIELVDVSSPKQTDTTQRWKAGLQLGSELQIRTKIEFSRRGALEGAKFERLDAEALRPYGLPPFLATHYAAPAAIAQKIHALAGRAEPQARDVFDLNALFARADCGALSLSPAERAWLPQAIEHARSISFDEYRSKVVAYLEPAQAELYEARDAWELMQGTVVVRLEGLLG